MKTILFLTLPLAALPAHALSLYKCEINGKVEYRDIPCATGKVEAIKVDPMQPDPIGAMMYRRGVAHDKAVVLEAETQRERDRQTQIRLEQEAARAAELQRRADLRCTQRARDLTWTKTTAAKYAKDIWWQHRVQSAQEDFDQDCRLGRR